MTRQRKRPEDPRSHRWFGALYQQHITRANAGCDFDFLHAGTPTPEPDIH